MLSVFVASCSYVAPHAAVASRRTAHANMLSYNNALSGCIATRGVAELWHASELLRNCSESALTSSTPLTGRSTRPRTRGATGFNSSSRT